MGFRSVGLIPLDQNYFESANESYDQVGSFHLVTHAEDFFFFPFKSRKDKIITFLEYLGT